MVGEELAHNAVEIKVHSQMGDNDVHPVGSSSKLLPKRSGQSPAVPSRQQVPSGNFSLFRRWVSWLVPLFVVVNIVIFFIAMYVNNCPKNSESCVGKFLGRFSFQPIKENPLLGPSSTTWVHSFLLYLMSPLEVALKLWRCCIVGFD